MVVTRTELTQIVDQVNKKFEELESKIKELEAKKQPVKKPAPKAA
jgi:phage shock protein A